MKKHILTLALLLLLQACGGGGDDSSTTDIHADGFYAPQYGDATKDTTYEADLASTTTKVVDYQDVGTAITAIVPESDGLVQVYKDMKVRLISMSKNECPQGLDGCDTTDSSSLRVGKSALIADLGGLADSVKNQGERGTCVAFALDAGLEVLLARDQQSTVLSEQNTYFEGKRETDTWDAQGLVPYDTVSRFVSNEVKFVSESSWPYNKEYESCSSYLSTYPDATCSETEAQGGGSDTRQQDPTAAAAGGYKLTTAHQLYASVGRIKQALYRGFPVAIAVNANYDFMLATYKSGVVSWVFKADDCGSSLCGHEILAVGYVDDSRVAGGGYLIVKNSWGQGWGDNGMGYATYEWLEHSLLDAQALVGYRSR